MNSAPEVPVREPNASGCYLQSTDVSIISVGARVCPASGSLGAVSAHGSPRELAFEDRIELYSDLSGNLMAGGILVTTYRVLPVGTRVELDIELSDWTKLRVAGHVSWRRQPSHGDTPPGLGIAFEELSPAALEALNRCCRTSPPLYIET